MDKRANISQMINLRFGAQALPFNPKARRKAERAYHHLPPLTDIKLGPRSRYEYFNGGSPEIEKDFLAPDFYKNCFLFLFFFVSFSYSIK